MNFKGHGRCILRTGVNSYIYMILYNLTFFAYNELPVWLPRRSFSSSVIYSSRVKYSTVVPAEIPARFAHYECLLFCCRSESFDMFEFMIVDRDTRKHMHFLLRKLDKQIMTHKIIEFIRNQTKLSFDKCAHCTYDP
jgi:hypothetical protein